MPTPITTGLYQFYLDCLRTKAAQPQRTLLDMLEIKLRADVVLANCSRSYSIAVRDLENPVQRFDQLGLPTDELIFEFVPARVWAWAEEQMPDPGNELDLSGGLIVRLSASTKAMGLPGQLVPQDAPSTWLLRQGPADEFLTLLRGIQAYQRKRRKRARKLLAQLQAYHAQQQPVLVMAPAAPVVAEATPTYRLADARTAVGVVLGYGAATMKRMAYRVGMAVGITNGGEVAL